MVTVSGGDKLALHMDQIAKGLGRGASLKVGFLEGSTYPDGTSTSMVAAIQEFGAPRARIPPRPFMRTMIADKSAEWGPAAADLLVQNNYDAVATMNMMGVGIRGQLQQSIIDVVAPPLSPVTLMLRKMKADNPSLVVTGATVGEAAAKVAAGDSYAGVSTKPLVDTGHLINSVEYEVTVIPGAPPSTWWSKLVGIGKKIVGL